MAKLSSEVEINPWRPSVVENVEHGVTTQVTVPLRRAQAVATIRFLRIMGWAAAAGFAGGMAWAFGLGYDWAGFILLGLLFILVAVAVASREPMDAFIACAIARHFRSIPRQRVAGGPGCTTAAAGAGTAYRSACRGPRGQWPLALCRSAGAEQDGVDLAGA